MATQPIPPASTMPSPAKRPRPRRRRWGLWLGVLLCLAALAGGGKLWLSASGQTATTDSVSKVVAVKHGLVEQSIESSGSVAANLEVEIKCRASGEVVKLPYDISDVVHEGDLLCQLDPTDEQLAVRSSEAALAQAKAQLEQARVALKEAELNLQTSRTQAEAQLASAQVQSQATAAKLERQRTLTRERLGSQEELEALEAEDASAKYALSQAQVAIAELEQQQVALESKRQDVALAEAKLDAQQIALDTQKQQLEYTTVNAPIDGVVSDLQVQKGSIVASGINNVSGGTTIMKLMDLSRMFVLATVDESDIGQVRTGQDAIITVDSFPDRSFKGKVVRVAVQGVAQSNVVTFEVKIEVTDEHKNLLKPAMTGNVTIIQDRRENVLVVPSGAVSRRGDRYVVKLEDGSARDVKIGLVGLDETEIVSGLKEGDRVLVSQDEPASKWRSEEHHPGPPMM